MGGKRKFEPHHTQKISSRLIARNNSQKLKTINQTNNHKTEENFVY